MSTLIELPVEASPLSVVVASNVRAEGARRGFNQSTLATAIGASRGTVSDKWRGKYAWTLDELEKVANALDVSLATLLRARRDSNPQPSDLESVAPSATPGNALARAHGIAPLDAALVVLGITAMLGARRTSI